MRPPNITRQHEGVESPADAPAIRLAGPIRAWSQPPWRATTVAWARPRRQPFACHHVRTSPSIQMFTLCLNHPQHSHACILPQPPAQRVLVSLTFPDLNYSSSTSTACVQPQSSTHCDHRVLTCESQVSHHLNYSSTSTLSRRSFTVSNARLTIRPPHIPSSLGTCHPPQPCLFEPECSSPPTLAMFFKPER